jgi:hypothetical protein
MRRGMTMRDLLLFGFHIDSWMRVVDESCEEIGDRKRSGG